MLHYLPVRDRSFFKRWGGGGGWWNLGGGGHVKKMALKGGPSKKRKGKGVILNTKRWDMFFYF